MKLTTNVIEILISFKNKDSMMQSHLLKKPSERRKNLKRRSTGTSRNTISVIGVRRIDEIKADEASGIKLFSKTLTKRLITNDNCQRRDLKNESLQMRSDDMNSI